MYLKRKYQVGGVVYTPYLPAQAGSNESSSSGATTATSSSPEKISGTVKGEIVNLLKENGLPSDVAVFLQKANSFLSSAGSLSGSSLFGGTGDFEISDLIKIQQLVNDVKYNNNLRNKAVEQVTKEAAGSEVAVTDSGYLYAQTKDGTLKRITPKEYADNKDEYAPLTNNQLLYLREQNPGLAFHTDILNDLQDTIGMGSITKYLRETIRAFGSDKAGGYTTKNTSVNRGLDLLTKEGPDGYYKFETEEQLRDVNRALTYLYNGMSENAKNLIKAKTAVEGGDPTDMRDVSNLLLHALYEHTSRTAKVDFDKQATDYDPKGTGDKGGSQLTQNDYLQRVGNLRGDRTSIMVVPRAAKITDTAALNAVAFMFGSMIDKDRQLVETTSLEDAMTKVEAIKAGNPSDITFGNRLLKPWERQGLMIDNSSNLSVVMLPYKMQDGHIVPDFDLLDKFNKLQAILSNNPYITQLELNTEARKLGIDPDEIGYDKESNTIRAKNTMAFISFSAYAGEDTIDLSKDDKKYLEQLDSDAGSYIEDLYNNLVVYGKIRPSKTDKYSKSGLGKSDSDEFWRGNVFIAMPNAFNAMNLSSVNEYVPKSSEMNFYDRVAARQIENGMQQYVRENDPNYRSNLSIGQFIDE